MAKFPYVNDKEYTTEQKSLIWFGIGIGAMALEKMLGIPSSKSAVLPRLISEASKLSLKNLPFTAEEQKELRLKPSELWTEDFENIMHSVNGSVLGTVNNTIKELFTGKGPAPTEPEEIEAFNKLQKFKGMINQKSGMIEVESIDDLIKILQELTPEDISEMTDLLDPDGPPTQEKENEDDFFGTKH